MLYKMWLLEYFEHADIHDIGRIACCHAFGLQAVFIIDATCLQYLRITHDRILVTENVDSWILLFIPLGY